MKTIILNSIPRKLHHITIKEEHATFLIIGNRVARDGTIGTIQKI